LLCHEQEIGRTYRIAATYLISRVDESGGLDDRIVRLSRLHSLNGGISNSKRDALYLLLRVSLNQRSRDEMTAWMLRLAS
jgi:hypothetical protein